MRIGIDTGGTFTDLVFFDGTAITHRKLPSTPSNPERAILIGLEPILKDGIEFQLFHGTTVSTNAFLQKQMVKSAFVCTAGFEHMLAIGRQNRTELFSLHVQKPSPLVPLALCFGVTERTLKDGTCLKTPSATEIDQLALHLKKQEVEAIGIVFLHSYRNPANEQLVASRLREKGFYVTASHEILPEYREYERAVITLLNSALKPIIADYINHLKDALPNRRLFIMQSNGGVLSPTQISNEPVRTILSGPAGGVIAALKTGRLINELNLITLDMGGTSTDVSVIKNSKLTLSRDGQIEHLPLHIPMIDIASVGAGGGSIARVDRGGVLQVGPESAGAEPGPACYGISELATVTDAFVVTGAIIPEMFLGGTMKIQPKRSVRAIREIANQLGKDIFETAEGIIRITVSALGRALRSVTLTKGEDPRFFSLMSYGGAGGMVAALLADRLGIKRIIIPPNQGVFSALGLLTADFRKDLTRSFMELAGPDTPTKLESAFAQMTSEAISILNADGFPEPELHYFVDVRYKGQSYELTVPYSTDYLQTFHQKHQRHYSYCLSDNLCEIVNLRLAAIGKTPGLTLPKQEPASAPPKTMYIKKVYFNGQSTEFDIYNRNDLKPGHRLDKPSIVVSDDATIIIPNGYEALVDDYTHMILTPTTRRD